ncbi:Transcription factor [Moelleriella libera RCEF 2490]|uniref:Transcription factor n=1 Tax=Moelleriella libera RCEF 2490 TaxID=1081109 RepID=A0A167VHQ5_9HYPO|nr:Transcription factor [Moelleriella libera RCEF 2490]
MAVFASGGCGLQLNEMFVNEAICMARTLRLHKSSTTDVGMLKTFWTIYSMEKMSSFTEGIASLMADEDIGCSLPIAPESMFGGIAGIMPLSALFILFDFIIHNRHHPDTGENLACLEAAAEYFRLLDMASGGELPGHIISEFASIALHYLGKLRGYNPEPDPCLQPASDSIGSTEPIQSSSFCDKLELFNQSLLDGTVLPYQEEDKLKTVFGWVFPDWGEFP